jgi:hypothetical protein
VGAAAAAPPAARDSRKGGVICAISGVRRFWPRCLPGHGSCLQLHWLASCKVVGICNSGPSRAVLRILEEQLSFMYHDCMYELCNGSLTRARSSSCQVTG